MGLYKYLSNGGNADEFVLESYQAMVLLEGKEKLTKILNNPFALEYIEEVSSKSSTVFRVGMYSAEDVQIFYVFKG